MWAKAVDCEDWGILQPVPGSHFPPVCPSMPLSKTGLFIFRDGIGFCSFAINQYFTISPTVLIRKEMSGRWNVHFGATEDGVVQTLRQREKIFIGQLTFVSVETCIRARGKIGHGTDTSW